jgi:hypothetical protein
VLISTSIHKEIIINNNKTQYSRKMNPPFFDRSRIHDIAWLNHNGIQKQFALFVSKPELYDRMDEVPEADKQDYMFHCFKKMLSKYYHWNVDKQYDELAYFGSLSQDKAGAVNVCGGGDNKSRSGRGQIIGGYKASQAGRKVKMDYLAKKYGLSFKDGDSRLFLGHTEPWKKLSPALLEKEGWGWVSDQCYSDETFQTPFPAKIDGDLIPLDIRNKVLQKWRAKRNAVIVVAQTPKEEDELPIKPESVSAPVPVSAPIVVAFSEEDLKFLEEEGW